MLKKKAKVKRARRLRFDLLVDGFIGVLSSFVPPCFHDALQHREVFGKCRAAFRCEGVAGLRAVVLDFFGDGDMARVVERAQVCDQVAVAHFQLRLEVLERPTRARGEQGHYAEPPAFVDELVELVEVEHGVQCVALLRGHVQAA